MTDATTQPPIPDPTVLTTQQMLREVENLRNWGEDSHAGHERVALERFDSLDKQLVLIERQRVEQKSDTEKAVQAALSAAKEAVKEQTTAFGLATAKSETAMTEQLKQLNVTIGTAIAGVNISVGDLKERVAKMESAKQGGREQLSLIYGFTGFLVALLILGGLFAGIGVS